MSKVVDFFESLLIPTIAIISLVISVADFFGWLGAIPWLSANRIPILTLLIASLALASLSRIQSKHSLLQEDVQHILSKSVLESTRRKLLEEVHPDLWAIFKDDFFKYLEIFETATERKRVDVHNVQEFQDCYRRTLRTHKGATFLATGMLKERYLWNDTAMNDAFWRFIHEDKGHIIRIFFVKDPKDLILPEFQKILNDQFRMKVEVYTVELNQISNRLKHIFMVESNGRFVWKPSQPLDEVDVQTVPATLIADEREAQKFVQIFQELLDSADRYKP